MHHLERRRMDRVPAEVAQEVGVLLEDEDVDAGAGEEEAQHHAGRPAAGDAAPRRVAGSAHAPSPDDGAPRCGAVRARAGLGERGLGRAARGACSVRRAARLGGPAAGWRAGTFGPRPLLPGRGPSASTGRGASGADTIDTPRGRARHDEMDGAG